MEAELQYIQQQLRSVIIHSLDTFNYKNAEFACEQLVAFNPECPDLIYLYALTNFRQGKFKLAFNKTSESNKHVGNHLGCAFIYAKLCLQLGKYREGIYRLTCLLPLFNDAAVSDPSEQTGIPSISVSPEPENNTAFFATASQRHKYEFQRSVFPDLSALYHVLGDLFKAEDDTQNACLNYSQALKFNVFDFEAFQELAKLGAEVKVKSIYKPVTRRPLSLPVLEPKNTNMNSPGESSGIPNPFATPRPSKNVDVILTPRPSVPTAPDAPIRRPINDTEFAKPNAPVPTRRTSYSKRPLAPPGGSYASRSGIKRNSSQGFIPDTRQQSWREIENADNYLRKLFGSLAKAFKSFSKFDCYKAIRLIDAFPESVRDTPWVLSKLGRLHYEIVNYNQSRKYFVRLRQIDRTRLEDMEYYSTLLWHLHRKVELTYLANEAVDIDQNSAVTWCVMGNLFSLLREPDEAIRCFDNAISIDPAFTYAHTLKGHEFYAGDNYEKALDCFRVSLLLDPRHYNALYGIGMVYINLGELHKADFHFRKAVSINPINIILLCCVGMVLEKLGKKTLALRQYELANKLQPLSALPLFKKALLLFSMQQFPQAIKQFELVKELAPNEASVHFLLGQLYNIQNDKFLAIREFTIALNLDPKGNYLIREAMEMLKD